MTNMAVTLPPQVTQAIAPQYYEKQSLGFCHVLASIGIAPSAEQCAPLQRQYLEAKNAIGKWYVGLSMYYRVLSGGAAPVVR